MDIGSSSLKDLAQGYHYDVDTASYCCNYCAAVFSVGQIFAFEDQFFDAKHAVEKHLEQEHGGNFQHLLHMDSKYNTFTNTQKKLLELFHSGISDKNIAAQLGISASTVRHQKFTFREKAKRAKMYLTLYDLAFEAEQPDEAIIPIHDTATMVDSRYVTTEKERQQILKAAFDSFDPLKLKVFPFKPKKHLVVLGRIAQEIQPEKEYSEAELKDLLEPIYEDHSLVRRLLVDYGFMDRTNDGTLYWLK